MEYWNACNKAYEHYRIRKSMLYLYVFRYYFGDGCETTRSTWKHLETAGFSDLQLRHIQAPLFFMIKPHIVGYAVK